MSAQIALAQPRRIKATHRRRRKVTAGPIVQRYYDPAIGRFLSMDPAAANAGPRFNRYSYANNGPYRFTDPDGRYACDGTRCDQFDKGVAKTNRMIDAMPAGAAKDAAREIMGKVGTNDGKGQVFHTDGKRGNKTAEFNQVTHAITVHIPMHTTDRRIGENTGHEMSHSVDATKRGDMARTPGQFTETETKAYAYSAAIAEAFGAKYTPEALGVAVKESVAGDIKAYQNYVSSLDSDAK